MKNENVSHRGVIRSLTAQRVTILAEGNASCDGCAALALCNKGKEGDSELITIDVASTEGLKVGEKVEITASSTSTLKATWWALILPTIVFVGIILLVRYWWPEAGAWSIGVGIAALAVYDFGLYLNRNRLATKMVWKIKKV